MHYHSTYTITRFNDNTAIAYVDSLVEEGWEREIAELIVRYLRDWTTTRIIVAEDILFNYLKAFLLENFNSISYRFHKNKQWSDTIGPIPFSWVHNGVTHLVIMNPIMSTALEQDLLLAEAGEDISYISTAELDNPLDENFLNNRDLLNYLGLRDSSNDTNLPVNSPSVIVDESTTRFSSAIWFSEIQKKNLIVAGVGGIGSWVVMLLARMKPNSMVIYDDDIVEPVNMAGQLYDTSSMGMYKVDAAYRMATDFCLYNNIFCVRERYTTESPTTDIMICGFDNMQARSVFFCNWLRHIKSKSAEERKHCLFIDGRLNAEEFQVLCIRGDDNYNIQQYASKFLFSDSEVEDEVCSYKQTSYMANMIASVMVNLFVNHVANEIEENLRDLPFFTSYVGDFIQMSVTS